MGTRKPGTVVRRSSGNHAWSFGGPWGLTVGTYADTMTPMQYLALLRGINVGGRTMLMADLRASFKEMGFRDATTVLQTGNVIFTSESSVATLKGMIEAGLHQRFDYPARVQVYRMSKVQEIVEASPFDGDDAERHSYVVFFEEGRERSLIAEVAGLDTSVERIALGDGVIFWQVSKGSTLHSGFAKYLSKARYRHLHTNRNINTLRKIVRAEPSSD